MRWDGWFRRAAMMNSEHARAHMDDDEEHACTQVQASGWTKRTPRTPPSVWMMDDMERAQPSPPNNNKASVQQYVGGTTTTVCVYAGAL